MRLYDAVNNVLKRLDDYPAVSSEQLWTRAEVELYVKDGYDAFCRQTKCILDFFYPENVPQAGNYVARWERGYFDSGMIAVGLINYSGGYWERDYAEASDTGPINHTQAWEATHSSSDGILSAWTLDETTGTRVDRDGNLDLTDYGSVTSATGLSGNAAHFVAASSQALYCDYAPELTDFSVSVWAKIGTPALYNAIFVISSYWSDYATIAIYKYDTEIRALIGNGTGFQYSTATWPGADWHHYVAVYDSSTQIVTLYVDGVAATPSSALTGTLSQASDSRLVIGATWRAALVNAFDNFFDGDIDSPVLYSKVLTSADVATLYAIQGLPPGGLNPYPDTTFAVSLHPVPEDNVTVDRATHDWSTLEPEFTRWLEENDRSYQTTSGDPTRFSMDRDGISRLRVVPAGGGDATTYDVSGTFGLLRDAADTDGFGTWSPIGTWGVLREIPEHFPMGAPFGIPRRLYSDVANTRVEYFRLGKDLDENQIELPDRFAKYVEFYAQGRALEKDGPGQDMKLAQHFMGRFAGGVDRMVKRLSENKRSRVSAIGSPGKGPTRPALARLPYRYGRATRSGY